MVRKESVKGIKWIQLRNKYILRRKGKKSMNKKMENL